MTRAGVRRARRLAALLAAALVPAVVPTWAGAQPASYRGFVEAGGVLYPQDAGNDPRNVVADLLGRVELFARPLSWLQLAGGVDVRVNSYGQVDGSWTPDLADRGVLKPPLSVRRLSASLHHGPVTLDIGRQVIRWGKTDIVTPTDRFAPRDFMNVIDSELLAVSGARLGLVLGAHSLEAVWVPYFTPSRLPLDDQRWIGSPPVEFVDGDRPDVPGGSQVGVRWSLTGEGFEYSLSLYDGFNHLPNVEPAGLPPDLEVPALPFVLAAPGQRTEVVRRFPALRAYGADLALPTRWFTAKAEATYFTSTTPRTDEFVLYVVQLERQSGEWAFVGGYAGEVVTKRRAIGSFAPDRGTARTLQGRASYAIDANRSAAVEGAVRQNGDGLYLKGEYSQARGAHWRATVSGGLIRGSDTDFIGQYRLNSHLGAALRYSF